MDNKRRQVIKAVGLGSISGTLAGILPLKSLALDSSTKAVLPRIALQTGLHTDKAFAEGTESDVAVSFESTIENYQSLVKLLSNKQGKEVIALIEHKDAILIEEAVRDSGARIIKRQQVSVSNKKNNEAQAYELGQSLVQGFSASKNNFESEQSLIVIAISA
jgi:hypothetical protein